MIAVSRFDVPDGAEEAFRLDAEAALSALAARPGFVRGRLGRALDEPRTWALVTEWDAVGSYRRGLSAYDVKLATAPLMALSVPEASAFEVLRAEEEQQAPLPGPAERAR